MSSYLETTSEVLGEYMLKGWTMTDMVCTHCRTTPLMREPVAQARAAGRSETQRIEFCGRCQGGPERPVQAPMDVEVTSSPSSSPAGPSAPPRHPSLSNGPIDLTPAQSYAIMNGQTSPSAIAALLSSSPLPPAATAPISLPPQTERTERSERDTQSDRASTAIGNLLLRGYALLGETCPNTTCHGIPLVRHPRRRVESSAGGGGGGATRMASTTEDKKECVICRRMYDYRGNLISPATGSGAATASAPAIPSIPVGTGSGSATIEDRKESLYERGARLANFRTDTNATALPSSTNILPNGSTRIRTQQEEDEAFDREMDELMADVGVPSASAVETGRAEPTAMNSGLGARATAASRRGLRTEDASSNQVQSAVSLTQTTLSQVLTQLSTSLQKNIVDKNDIRSSGYQLHTYLERMKEVMEVLEVAERLKGEA